MKIYSAYHEPTTIFPGRLGRLERRYLELVQQVIHLTARVAMLPMVPLTMVLREPVRTPLWLIAFVGLHAARYSLMFMSAVEQAMWMFGLWRPDSRVVRIIADAAEITKEKLVPNLSMRTESKPASKLVSALDAVGCVVFVIAIVPIAIVTSPFVGWVPKAGRNHDLKQIIQTEIAIAHRAFVLFVPVALLVALCLLFTPR